MLFIGIVAAACAGTSRRPDAVADGRFFHLLDRVDAWNLTLAPDGVYLVDVEGCDFFGTSCGRWRALGDDIELLPQSGAERMWWPNSAGSGIAEVVTLRPTPAGYAASGNVTGGPIAQTWARGSVCPNCETGGGPSGLHACPDTVPDRSRCDEPPPPHD